MSVKCVDQGRGQDFISDQTDKICERNINVPIKNTDALNFQLWLIPIDLLQFSAMYSFYAHPLKQGFSVSHNKLIRKNK